MAKLKPFGERIKELREERGWSQEDLSRATGFLENEISEWEDLSSTYVTSDEYLIFSNIFEKPIIEIVKGIPEEEEILNRYLIPRFCCNHEKFIVPRQEDGFENKFCSDCGEKLSGDCEHCGAPMSSHWWSGEHYCGVCGNKIQLKDKGRGEELYWEVFDRSEGEDWLFIRAAQHSFRYRVSICQSFQLHLENPDMIAPSSHPLHFHPLFFHTLRYHFQGRIDYCTICGQKKMTHCPQCDRPLIGLSQSQFRFCSGCGYKFWEQPKEKTQEVERSTKHVWQRTSDGSKDLQISNPEQFDNRAYARLARGFMNAAQRINSKLQQTLTQLERYPENVILKGDGDSRAGYLGLNRWCLTQSRRDQRGVEPARKLWEFLFGEEEPTQLALLAKGSTGVIEVPEDVWDSWYEKISKTEIIV